MRWWCVGLALLAGVARGEIVGQVLDPGGAPVAAARVHLRLAGAWAQPPAASTVTDADGWFTFASPAAEALWQPVEPRPEWPYGQLLVEGTAWAVGAAWVQAADRVTLRLEPPTSVRVPLLDPRGRPAAGVAVRVSWLARYEPWRGLGLTVPRSGVAFGQAVTGPDGVARFDHLPPDADVVFESVDEHYVVPLAPRDLVRPRTRATGETTAAPVKLLPGCSVAGRLTDPAGRPVSGAQVVWRTTSPFGVATGLTGADGRYRLAGLAGGIGTLGVVLPAPLVATEAVPAREPVALEPGEDRSGLDLQAVAGTPLTVRVLTDDGAPVPGARVYVQGPQWPGSLAGLGLADFVTGADGTARGAVVPGEQQVGLWYVPPPFLGDPNRTPRPATVRAGQPAAVTLSTKRRPEPVHGQVLTAAGEPAAGAALEYEGTWGPGPVVTADEQGRFVLPRAISAPAAVRARWRTQVTAEPVKSVAGEALVVRLAERALARVRCQVTDDEGHPVPGATVELTEYGLAGSHRYRYTDEQGRVAFEDCVPNGDDLLGAGADGYGTAYVKLALAPGQDRDLGVVRVVRADQVVAGFVVDEAGKPVPMAFVQGIGANYRCASVCDANGEFRLEGVTRGKVGLQVTLSGDPRRAEVEVNAGDETVLIRLKPRPGR